MVWPRGPRVEWSQGQCPIYVKRDPHLEMSTAPSSFQQNPAQCIFRELGGWPNLQLLAGSLTWSDECLRTTYCYWEGNREERVLRFDYSPPDTHIYSRGGIKVHYDYHRPTNTINIRSIDNALYRKDGRSPHTVKLPMTETWYDGRPKTGKFLALIQLNLRTDLFPFG